MACHFQLDQLKQSIPIIPFKALDFQLLYSYWLPIATYMPTKQGPDFTHSLWELTKNLGNLWIGTGPKSPCLMAPCFQYPLRQHKGWKMWDTYSERRSYLRSDIKQVQWKLGFHRKEIHQWATTLQTGKWIIPALINQYWLHWPQRGSINKCQPYYSYSVHSYTSRQPKKNVSTNLISWQTSSTPITLNENNSKLLSWRERKPNHPLCIIAKLAICHLLKQIVQWLIA